MLNKCGLKARVCVWTLPAFVRGSSLEGMPSTTFNQGQVFPVILLAEGSITLSGPPCPLPPNPVTTYVRKNRQLKKWFLEASGNQYPENSLTFPLPSSRLAPRQPCHPLLWASELWFASQFLGNFTIQHIQLSYVKDTVSCISSKTLLNNISLIRKSANRLRMEGF